MTETALQPWAFRIVRYIPRLDRDEAANLGVLLYSARENRLEARLLREEGEFARIRRLHPGADLPLLRNFEAALTQRLAGLEGDAAAQVEKLEGWLSNTIQLGPQRAVLTDNAAAELERIYDDYVAPPRLVNAPAGAEAPVDSPAAIRRAASKVFADAGVLQWMRPARAATWTAWPGDTTRLDFHFRVGDADGFAQAVSLQRDVAQAKAFAFTAERIRARARGAQVTAITDAAPQAQDERHAFVHSILTEQEIEIVPLALLAPWAERLASRLQ